MADETPATRPRGVTRVALRAGRVIGWSFVTSLRVLSSIFSTAGGGDAATPMSTALYTKRDEYRP